MQRQKENPKEAYMKRAWILEYSKKNDQLISFIVTMKYYHVIYMTYIIENFSNNFASDD